MNTVSWQRYESYSPDIRKVQKLIEKQQFDIFSKNTESNVKLNALYPLLVNLWRNLAKYLNFKYSDGYFYDCKIHITALMAKEWNLKCENPEELQNVIGLGYDEEWLTNPVVGFIHPDCGVADGSAPNEFPCLCGYTQCNYLTGLYCESKSQTCAKNSIKMCEHVDGALENEGDCVCGNVLCDAKIGLFCESQKNLCFKASK